MRGLFLALVLANVAFFGWAHWIDVPPATQASTSASALPLLALADSGNAAAGAAAAGAPAAAHLQQGEPAGPAVQGPVGSGIDALGGNGAQAAAGAQAGTGAPGGKDARTRCRSLGPFTGAAAARVAADLLRARQLAPRSRTVDISLAGGTVSAYWLDLDLGANEPDPPLAALRAGTGSAGAAGRVTAARAAAVLRGVAFSDCPAVGAGG